MPTRVFLTIDTELAWRHHSRGHPVETVFARSIEPAGVGIEWQLACLARHGLKACFFVDPMPARVYGSDLIARIVAPILAAGQEVQLHIHPNWDGACDSDRQRAGPFELTECTPAEQLRLLREAHALLVAAGAPSPVAFRAGSYAADDATLDALAALGIAYDSSFNPAWPAFSRIGLSPRQLAPVRHCGIVELPVGWIEDRGGAARTLQVCALSGEEMQAALDHADAEDHALVTIVSHSFELATRSGTRVNARHVARFERLCAYLAAHRDRFTTVGIDDLGAVPLDRDDTPLAYDAARWLRRQGEQAWVNEVIESRRGLIAAATTAAGMIAGIEAAL